MDIKRVIKRIPGFKQVVCLVSMERKAYRRWKREVKKVRRQLKKTEKRIIYCGMCEDSNMGDMAQIYCAEKWMHIFYPGYNIIRCHAATFMLEQLELLEVLRTHVNPDDIFIFQCGYNTHDLGGYQDQVRQKILLSFPNNEVIVLPQTVYFKSEDRKKLCSQVYNAHRHMFFMARDPVSLEIAREMFPNVYITMYPDIVATLIGKYNFSGKREDICLCMRNDIEQYYSLDQRQQIKADLEKYGNVVLMDTVIPISYDRINRNIEKYVLGIIYFFAKQRIVVTDKYHGTIFSLVANTPVIMLRTTDHKLTSIYKRFKEVYPDRIFFANTLGELDDIVQHVLDNPCYNRLPDYFDKIYYQDLYSEIRAWEKEQKAKREG